MWLSYSQLVLVFLSAAMVLLTVVLLCRRRSTFASLPSSRPGLEEDYFLPILVHETRYPSFTKILALVFNQFGSQRFLADPRVREAFDALRSAAFERSHPKRVISDMSLIVRTLISDPDVEYRLREDLPPLIELFLAELHKDDAESDSSSG
jgi:hypothetical protein